jgi:hypothetical protein
VKQPPPPPQPAESPPGGDASGPIDLDVVKKADWLADDEGGGEKSAPAAGRDEI